MYVVQNVNFKLNPLTYKFIMDNDKEVTLAEYFKISYDKVITNNK